METQVVQVPLEKQEILVLQAIQGSKAHRGSLDLKDNKGTKASKVLPDKSATGVAPVLKDPREV